MIKYMDINSLSEKQFPTRKKWVDQFVHAKTRFKASVHLGLGLGLYLVSHAASAGVLPLEFTSVPQVTDMAIGQKQTLTYTIHNQVATRSLPIRSIRVLNAGDQQNDNSVVATQTTCGSLLPPNGSCTITVTLSQLQSGTINRILSIDYNGRAPLTTPIRSTIANADYTVLVYIVGSDLESDGGQATFNIEQMMEVGSSSKMNIVLETGGARAPGWRTVQRKVVYPGQVSVVDDLGLLNMSLTDTIEDFVQWGVTSFPAQKYILIYWDHGGGPNGGFGGDELFQNASTPINQLSAVAQNIYTKMGTHFELIGFDACFLGNAETYAGLYPYTNYLIGSEDLEPGNGWQYNTFLSFIQQKPTASGLDIGINIANGFTEQNKDDSTTLSVVDASAMPNVLSAINAFADALKPHTNDVSNWISIAASRLKAPDYSTSVWDNKSRDLVDLVEFAKLVQAQFASDMPLYFASGDLIVAVNEAVKYTKNSENRQASHGLSAYFPSILPQYITSYPQTTVLNGNQFFSLPYMQLVTSYHDFYSANTNSLETTISNMMLTGTTYSADLSSYYDQAFAAVGNEACDNVYSRGHKISSTPCYSSISILPLSSFPPEPPLASISFINSDSWPLVNGTPVFLIPDIYPNLPNEENYLIPVMKMDGSVGYLFALIENNEYVVRGFQPEVGSSNTQGKLEAISEGEQFYLRTFAQDPNEFNNWALLRTDTSISAPFTISFGALPASLPAFNSFRFLVADLTGRLAVSDPETF
ncbi:clostripain-related cysteine peptidase [uncultured Legionella sp.]|uniref:clostripain-related cysteine peptidase n=1 Tax=uncultured Legionella sp. TaxID=210934 RepID=UPI002630CF44|nr:clostripain-related cysteine peptidase [uncultured Legionella sp.]